MPQIITLLLEDAQVFQNSGFSKYEQITNQTTTHEYSHNYLTNLLTKNKNAMNTKVPLIVTWIITIILITNGFADLQARVLRVDNHAKSSVEVAEGSDEPTRSPVISLPQQDKKSPDVLRGLTYPENINVTILSPDEDGSEGLRADLDAYEFITATSFPRGDIAGMSVADLQPYDVVITFNVNQWDATGVDADPDHVGDVIAAYIDQGGGFIECQYVMDFFGWELGGDYFNQGYSPWLQADDDAFNVSNLQLGTLHEPGHPILTDVNTFGLVGPSTMIWFPGTSSGATLIADWANGEHAIAVKDRVVGINILPVVGGSINYSGDGTTLFKNAIVYLMPEPVGQFTISFEVQDHDNAPIEEASISIAGIGMLQTDAQGQAEIDLPDGNYSATINASGYVEKTKTFTVDGDDKTVTIQLEDVIEEPVNVAVTTDGMEPGEAHFSWEMPDVPTETFTEDWDGYSDWTTDLSPWTTIDQHGGVTWGASNFDFPIEQDVFAWGVMNPSETNPPIDVEGPQVGVHDAYSGSKYVFSVGQTDPPAEENKWLISPQLEVTEESILSFAAKTKKDDYGLERLRVYVSTTGTNPADFVEISPSPYVEVPTTWTEYSYPLEAYAGQSVYFAVENVSHDAFMLFLDAFEVTEVLADRKTKHAGRAFRGFNVYMNDMETPVGVELPETEHMFTELPGGTHTAGVQAVYSSGVSEIVTAEFEMEATEITVTFNVTDQDGLPVENATITLGTVENDPGDYIFEDIEPGSYTYTVAKDCFVTAEEEVILPTQDVTIDVELGNIPGDANDDGEVNVLDLIVIAQYYTQQDPEPLCFINADVLGNGEVNVLDIIAVAVLFLE